jgi:hypothetical protein
MLSARPLARLVAVLLLTFAAMDLARPASCDESQLLAAGQTQVRTDDAAQAPGHGCDACFCCSRVVRAELMSAFGVVDGTGLRSIDAAPPLVFAPTAPPYHPPLL